MKKVVNYYVIAYYNQGKDQLKWNVAEHDIDKKIAEIKRCSQGRFLIRELNIEKIEVEKEIITTKTISTINKEDF